MAGIATDPLAVSHHSGATAIAKQLIIAAASRTLTKEESGAVVLVATDALVMTLPAASERPGMAFTFVNGGADAANILDVQPASGDGIVGSVPNAAGDSVASGTDDEHLKNTKASANNGDRVTLMSDGNADWYITSGVGIWASAA